MSAARSGCRRSDRTEPRFGPGCFLSLNFEKRLFFSKKQKGSQGFISCMEVHASAVAEAVGSYVRAWPTCSSPAVDDRALRPRLCALRYENNRRREKKGELAAEISFRRRGPDCKNARMPDGRGGAAIMRAPYSGTVLSRPHIVEMKGSGCRASLTPCSPSNSNAKWLAGALLSRRLCTRHVQALQPSVMLSTQDTMELPCIGFGRRALCALSSKFHLGGCRTAAKAQLRPSLSSLPRQARKLVARAPRGGECDWRRMLGGTAGGYL
ncbi:hypothetical protein L1887_55786 [Cichorium endivia]|nr:hypothetical protein L1887_55786 [Cichorium endivia]